MYKLESLVLENFFKSKAVHKVCFHFHDLEEEVKILWQHYHSEDRGLNSA
jgi:hypothetical protein